jgi:hypothetical protein
VGRPIGTTVADWEPMGTAQPGEGWTVLNCPLLAAAIEANDADFKIDIRHLKTNHYIKAGDTYYKPTGSFAHKISQFADDSTLLAHPSDIPRFDAHLDTWCKATAMKENATKREAMLLGRLRREPHRAPKGVVPNDRYLADGNYLTHPRGPLWK